MSAVKQRRSEVGLTQQEAARRSGVSVATWRRFENEASLDGFRKESIRGFARALNLDTGRLQALLAGGQIDDSGLNEAPDETAEALNAAFKGDPLTPADAYALGNTVAFSDFPPSVDGRYHIDGGLALDFRDYLKGEATIRDVGLLGDLPDWVLTQVNNHWLLCMGERIMRIGNELLEECRIPTMQCLADEVAMSIIIFNSDPPQLGDGDLIHPGLLGPEDIFGYDPDRDDPDDDTECRCEWWNRMFRALLPSEFDHDFRRYDIILMESFGQGLSDPTDPRHPLRWFERDDLRERYESALRTVRLPKEERDRLAREAMDRAMSAFLPRSTR